MVTSELLLSLLSFMFNICLCGYLVVQALTMQAQPFMLIMESMPPKIRSLGMSTVVSLGMMGQYALIEMYMLIRGGIL